MHPSTPEFRSIRELSPDAVAPLLEASAGEGFRFVARLVAEWTAGATRFDGPGELLVGVYVSGRLVGVGGLTADPYTAAPGVGRLRRLYVLPEMRRQGIGQQLVRALEAHATGRYAELVLRTDTSAAALFYERLGYEVVALGGTATHRKRLAMPGGAPERAIQ
ncbi:GNAT family N-acetyltransferase [Sorangium sp. So ce321]|uniref:GNAT family N-acetyltransferase n=1 Tax=Sorangium sp. So ce321 TaxID=3133300 RepID=UPI003F5E543B